MLHTIKTLERCHILATDGEIGRVTDIYFDDDQWVVRYLVVDTGNWLDGRKVLISPYAVKLVDWSARATMVNLTRAQVARSPGIDTDKPVSRQHESEYHHYYGFPEYWPYTTYWAWGAMPIVMPNPQVRARVARQHRSAGAEKRVTVDTHLRSSREVVGYRIEARDAPIGHVDDFIFDEETWAIRYAVIDTRNWLPGRHVLIAPEWIRAVNWAERSLAVGMLREDIKRSPEYDPNHLPDLAYEQSRVRRL